MGNLKDTDDDATLTPALRKDLKLLRGFGSIRQPTAKSRFFSIRFYVKGQLREESVRSVKISDAVKLLKRRHGEVNENKFVTAEDAKLTFEEMVKKLEAHYRRHALKATPMVTGVNGLLTTFANWRALDITKDAVLEHVDRRLKEGYAAGTLNRELTYLNEMFNLVGTTVIPHPPEIEKLAEKNTRKGFFERDQLEQVCKYLPPEMQDVARVAYITGWRVFNEILTRRWSHVGFEGAGYLRLEPGETKNGEGRTFPMILGLREILERRRDITKVEADDSGRLIPWVFHHRVGINGSAAKIVGRPLTNRKWYYKTWNEAVKKSGVERIPHDFRRTAIRNLEFAGVPRSAAMAMVGHKTESVYRRYAIADKRMLDLAADRLETFLNAEDEAVKKR